jgi:hypothetical protein
MSNLVSQGRYDALWTETDRALYHQLPIYLAKYQVDFIKRYTVWPKALKPKKWEANMGNKMRGVRKEPTPILRSQLQLTDGTFGVSPITQTPRKDVIEAREVHEDVQLYRHDFESNLFHFLPSFQDFLTDHVDFNNKQLNEQIQIFADHFYRTAIFHGSPYIWICGKPAGTELTAVDYWRGETIALSKNQGTMQDIVNQVTRPLNLRTIHKIGTVMFNDVGATPFSGGVSESGSTYKYKLIHGPEVEDYLSADAFLLANKDHNRDVIGKRVTGEWFGRMSPLTERFELRIAADGSFPAPEVIEENPASYNYGETVPNPTYVNAPFGVTFVCGSEAYKYMQIGSPPREWANMTMKEFARLDWNGRVDVTKNVLVPGRDSANNLVTDTNKRGEYLQLIASLALGILPIRRRNILPAIYQRARISTLD